MEKVPTRVNSNLRGRLNSLCEVYPSTCSRMCLAWPLVVPKYLATVLGAEKAMGCPGVLYASITRWLRAGGERARRRRRLGGILSAGQKLTGKEP